MAEIVNLRLERKSRARAMARQKADENAAKFGRTKQQKDQESRDKARAARLLDGVKRENPTG